MIKFSHWTRPVLLLPVLLAGCAPGAGRVSSVEQALQASQSQGSALRQRVAELESALEAERRAAGDLAAIEARMAQARASLGAAQRARSVADSQARGLRERLAAEERRLGGLQSEAGQLQQVSEERRGTIGEKERSLAALQDEAAAAERRLAGLREQSTARTTGSPPSANARGLRSGA
jgi:predicted  nucleic acid-binding Zn-ribbon protein